MNTFSVPLAARLGNSLVAAATLIKVSLEEKLVYRFDLIVGLIRTAILILVFRYLWLALYAGQETYNGVTVGQTITYAALSMVISPLFPNSLILEVGSRIRNGSILFDITRPIYFGNLLLYQMMGQFVATLLTSSLPMFALTFLFVEMAVPKSPVVWLAFLVSLFLGFLTAFLVGFHCVIVRFLADRNLGNLLRQVEPGGYPGRQVLTFLDISSSGTADRPHFTISRHHLYAPRHFRRRSKISTDSRRACYSGFLDNFISRAGPVDIFNGRQEIGYSRRVTC